MSPERHRSPRLGYALAAAAAAMWALNGSLARFLLDDGVSAFRLSQLRSLVSFLVLFAVVAVIRRDLLKVRREDLPRLAFLGIAGLAFVHAAYFFAIERLQIGVALVIQYLGPLLILLWLTVAHRRRLRPALWGAAALSVVGCFFVVGAYNGLGDLDGIGLLAAAMAAVFFALYLVASERSGHRYEAATTLIYGFGFASLFWAIAQPLWSFPTEEFQSAEPILLGLGVAIIGTLIPFILIVAALRHIPAPRAGIVATLEPVLAALFAWLIHDEELAALQLAGGVLVVAAAIWVQLQRGEEGSESAPAYASKPTAPALEVPGQ